jgi:hypothetical protein
MTLNQNGSSITGSWTNNNNGCTYSGTGTYNSTTKNFNITFTTNMDPKVCCSSFNYTGTVTNCDSMSLNWNNNCNFDGSRQF